MGEQTDTTCSHNNPVVRRRDGVLCSHTGSFVFRGQNSMLDVCSSYLVVYPKRVLYIRMQAQNGYTFMGERTDNTAAKKPPLYEGKIVCCVCVQFRLVSGGKTACWGCFHRTYAGYPKRVLFIKNVSKIARSGYRECLYRVPPGYPPQCYSLSLHIGYESQQRRVPPEPWRKR